MSTQPMTLEQLTARARQAVANLLKTHPDFGQPATNLTATWAYYGAEALLSYPEALANAAPKHRHAYEEARHGGARLIAAGHVLPQPWGPALVAAILNGSMKPPHWPKRQADRYTATQIYSVLTELGEHGIAIYNATNPDRTACAALAAAMAERKLLPNTTDGVRDAYRDFSEFAAKIDSAPGPMEGDTIQHRGFTARHVGGQWTIHDWAYDRPWAPRLPSTAVVGLPA